MRGESSRVSLDIVLGCKVHWLAWWGSVSSALCWQRLCRQSRPYPEKLRLGVRALNEPSRPSLRTVTKALVEPGKVLFAVLSDASVAEAFAAALAYPSHIVLRHDRSQISRALVPHESSVMISHDQAASLRVAPTGATQVLSLASIFRRAFAWQRTSEYVMSTLWVQPGPLSTMSVADARLLFSRGLPRFACS